MDLLTERRLSRRSLLRYAAGTAIGLPLAGLLVACGSSDETSSGTQATSVSTPPVQATATGEPRRGGTLRVALTGDPPNLDLMQTTDSIVMLITGHIYETLFTWDDEYRPAPLLAESHEIADDALLHTIKIRKGVPFHNGELLTAADVVASIQRWGELSGLGENLLKVTDSIQATDDHTVEIRLTEPFGILAMSLCRQLQGCAIYPKSVLDLSTTDELAEFVGTGPYTFVEWQPDVHVSVRRFDDYASHPGEHSGYAGKKSQWLDGIEFAPVRTEASRVAGVLAGDFQYMETVSPDQRASFEGKPTISVQRLPADSWLNIVLNLRSPALQDLNVRRAIQTALDHRAIMQAAFGEGFYELTPELVPGALTWFSEAGIEYFNVNKPDDARKLLTDAGYDGTPLRFMVTQEVQQEYNASVTMKQQLERVGFVVDLQVFDGATLSDKRSDDTAWELYTAWASFRPDPTMRNLTAKAQGWWEDAEKDTLLKQLQSESDYDTRFGIWEEVQRRFYHDVPRLKIGNDIRLLVHASKLRDIGPTAMQPDFANAWLSD